MSIQTLAAAAPLSQIETPNLRQDALRSRLSALLECSRQSNFIFGSPLGPAFRFGRHLYVPRFVYFGPHTHEESLRLAFYSGFSSRDWHASAALLDLVERLLADAWLGQGLNLSFFPSVSLAQQPSLDLSREDWSSSEEPEIRLLRQDIRNRGYHGFIRIEVSDEVEEMTARLAGRADPSTPFTGVELVDSADFEPFPVRFEGFSAEGSHPGPLSLADDLPFHAFELVIQVPSAWPGSLATEAIHLILRRFIARYRSLQAFGQHL